MSADIAYVPVPTQWLSQIYARLGELAAEGSMEGMASAEPSSFLSDALLKRMYEESYEPHRRLMRLMAEHADEWRYSNEIAADLELEHGTRGLAGMFGAFGRRAKHRYGGLTPWLSEWDSAREEVRYCMPSEVAASIRDLARAA